MVGIKKIAVVFLLMFLSGISTTMAQSPFASISVNKNSVYVGEPIKVVVTAYTPTYFTAPAKFENIQIKGAFSVFFKANPVSRIINNVRYSGIQRTYNIFPYDEKNVEIPPFEIRIVTPVDGGYQGVERTVKTKKKIVKVKPVPEGFDKDEWLVASNVRVTENWKGNVKEVKVGDVIEQHIERTAYGTVAELILPIIWDTIPNVSLYPTRSSVENIKSETAISAKRTEGVRYLFEKEGDYIIPEREITWWNPNTNKLYKKTISGLNLKVIPNPDLGMMQSMKDSLDLLNKSLKKEEAPVEEEKELTILGMSLKEFLIKLGLLIVLLYYVVKYLKKLIAKISNKREAYLHSEKYFFTEFIKSIASKNHKKILNKMYHWLDNLELESPTMQSLGKYVDDKKLNDEIEKIMHQLESDSKQLKLNAPVWIEARKNYLKQKNKANTIVDSNWINP